MIRKILGTIGSRLLIMLFTIIVVICNSRYLGASGQGTAALIQFGVLLVVALNNFIGGGAVVYLSARIPANKLALPAYSWSLLVAFMAYFVFKFTAIVPSEYALEVAFLGLLQSLFGFHLMVIMGSEHIKSYNTILSIQALLLVGALLGFYFIDTPSIDHFIHALFVSFGGTFFLAFLLSWKRVFAGKWTINKSEIKELWDLGKYGQSGNLLQMLTYRSNLVFLEKLSSDRSLVGIYSIGLYGSEAIWNISKSLSTIQYSRISNMSDRDEIRKLSLAFFHVSLMGTLILVFIMLLIPDRFYTFVLGDEMVGIRAMLFFLAPGILANACSGILSHHFSGIGMPSKNTLSSGIALAVTIVSALILIPYLGLIGAAITASLAYSCQFLSLLFSFLAEEKSSQLSDFIPKKASFHLLREAK
ncbi:MAG: polysaccharide biosynthesis C-terminal domain-containing protein [Bacteroidetes bacterium]|nr:polysaccharide biosynthesis C-terminal domain-containing protein [Bacteroidota bacterium]